MLRTIICILGSLIGATAIAAFASTNLTSIQVKGERKSMADNCTYWQSTVDPSIEMPSGFKAVSENHEQSVVEGIECLLSLEGNKNRAKFSGATKPYVSQLFKPATVEVAALYYISYLYHQKWDHADAIALRDKNGEVNTQAAVKEAYKNYRAWFKQIKKIGLVKARESKLDPLRGSWVKWY